MTWTWLDEAVWKWANFDYYHKHFCGKQIPEQELADEMFGALDDAYENIDRMARVIRELVQIFNFLWASVDADSVEKHRDAYNNLSPDTKELLK